MSPLVRQRGATVFVPVAVLLCASFFLLATATARADYEPVGSGATKITFAKSFLAACRINGVKLSAVAPAELSGGVLTVPAVGGRFDPVAAKGTVEGEGALVLTAGGRRIPIKALKLRTTQRHSPFTAKVGGSQLKLATASKITVRRAGFDDRVQVAGLAVGPTLAVRLGKKLALRQVFRAGMPLGVAVTTATPATIGVLEQGFATLTLDPGLVAKLESLFVAVNPIFPAEHQGSVFSLPIFGGAISPSADAGRLETLGSVEFLQLGGGQVFWREPWLEFESRALNAEIDAEPSPPYSGKTGRLGVAPLSSLGVPVVDSESRSVSAGFTLALEASMAQTFEEAFAKPLGKSSVFTPGEPLGSISFMATGQQ
jgi:hypothetical protein